MRGSWRERVNGAVPESLRGMTVVVLALILASCSGRGGDLRELHAELLDQHGARVVFPDALVGKVALVGYVYTHCPDICPMVTYNMRDVQRALAERGVPAEDVMLVSISFDPRRDTPDVLKGYADSYRLDTSNWMLLTGDPAEVDRVMRTLGIAVQKLPSRFMEDGSELYFMNHSDRVTLLGPDLRIVGDYTGSELRKEDVMDAIREQLGEVEMTGTNMEAVRQQSRGRS